MSEVALQDLIARSLNVKPRDVVGIDVISSQYYTRDLLRKVYAIFDFNNLPNTWDRDYLLEHLFIDGMVGITDTIAGVVPLKCGFSGKLNIYDKCTELIFANSVLGNFTRELGKDAWYLHLNPDYAGVMDMVNKYAVLLGMCDASVNLNLLNSRVAFIGEAVDQSQANVLKKLYTMISKSEPCVVYKKGSSDKELKWYWNNVKQCYVANDIMDTKRRIMAEFLTEIGLKVSNTEKKERLVSSEANSTVEEKNSSIYVWKTNLENDVEKINKMFDLNIEVSVNVFGGVDNATSGYDEMVRTDSISDNDI